MIYARVDIEGHAVVFPVPEELPQRTTLTARPCPKKPVKTYQLELASAQDFLYRVVGVKPHEIS